MAQKGFAPILILIGVLIIGSVIGGGYYFIQKNKASEFTPTLQIVASPLPESTASPSPSVETVATPTPLPSPKPSPISSPVTNPKVVPTPQPVAPVKKTVTITLSGKVFNDKNCNEVLEAGEEGIPNIPIDIEYMPAYSDLANVTSDSSGNYSFSKSVGEDETISIGPSVVAPSGYKIHGRDQYSNMNKMFPTLTLNVPLVPIEAINQGLCSTP